MTINRRISLMASVMGLFAGESIEDWQRGRQLYSSIKFAHRVTPNKGTPSGAARAKRIARKRRNIRARSAK